MVTNRQYKKQQKTSHERQGWRDLIFFPMKERIAAVPSSAFDLGETTALNSTLLCRVPMSYNHRISQYDQVRDLTAFIHALNWNY